MNMNTTKMPKRARFGDDDRKQTERDRKQALQEARKAKRSQQEFAWTA